MRLSVSLLAIAATAAVAPAQFLGCTNPGNRLGLTDGWDSPTQGAGTSFIHAPGVAAAQGPGEILTRIESDHMIGWGLDPNDPTLMTKAILGYEFFIQDQNENTIESFTLIGRTEDPAAPNFPDVTNPGVVISTAPIPMPTPTNPAGMPIAWVLCFTFQNAAGQPSAVSGIPDGQDLFVGVGVDHTGGGWPMSDLLSIAAVSNDPAFLPYDEPGRCANLPPPGGMPAGTIAIAEASYVGSMPTGGLGMGSTGPFAYTNDIANSGYFAQNNFELFLDPGASGGVAVTLQLASSPYPAAQGGAHFSGAFTSNGTPNGLSGFYPNVASMDTRGTDDIGFVYLDKRVVNGPVLVAWSTGPRPAALPPIPVANVGGPGSSGAICIDPTFALLAGIVVTDASGRGGFNVGSVLSPIVRQNLDPIGCVPLYWQAFGIDPATGNIHGSGCAQQRL